MEEGWLKFYRKFTRWEWYKTPHMYHFFSHLLFNANREDSNWQGIVVKRGQLVIGRKQLSADTGISEQSVRTCIERLKSTSEITIKSTNKYSIITIIKYEDYQLSKNEINQLINQQTNQQSTNNQPATNHKQEYKNIRNKEKNIGITRAHEKKSLQDLIIDTFIQEHKNYQILDYEKEKIAAGTLIDLFLEKYPLATDKQIIDGLKPYFTACVSINDDWMRPRMSLPFIVSNFNQINNTIRDGNKKGKQQGGLSPDAIARIVASTFGVDPKGDR